MGPLLDLLIHTRAAALPREQPNFLYGNMQKTNFFPWLLPLMFSRANNFRRLVYSNLNSVYVYIYKMLLLLLFFFISFSFGGVEIGHVLHSRHCSPTGRYTTTRRSSNVVTVDLQQRQIRFTLQRGEEKESDRTDAHSSFC